MRLPKITTLFIAAALFISSGFTQPDNSIAQFGWMLGSWQGKSGKGDMYETWRKQDDQTMLGEGYYVVKGDTVLREILRIQKIGNFWTYIPIINKQDPVLFTLKKAEKGVWEFENKEHGFPKKIAYKQQPDGSMLAWIEGKMLGKNMKDEYLMQKVK